MKGDILQNILTEILKFQSKWSITNGHPLPSKNTAVKCRNGNSHKRKTERVAKLFL